MHSGVACSLSSQLMLELCAHHAGVVRVLINLLYEVRNIEKLICCVGYDVKTTSIVCLFSLI